MRKVDQAAARRRAAKRARRKTPNPTSASLRPVSRPVSRRVTAASNFTQMMFDFGGAQAQLQRMLADAIRVDKFLRKARADAPRNT